MNRRDLLKTLVAGTVALSAGLQLRPEQKRLLARFAKYFDIRWDQWVARVDVLLGMNQYAVDFRMQGDTARPEEIEPAMTLLLNHIEHHQGVKFEKIELGKELTQNA